MTVRGTSAVILLCALVLALTACGSDAGGVSEQDDKSGHPPQEKQQPEEDDKSLDEEDPAMPAVPGPPIVSFA